MKIIPILALFLLSTIEALPQDRLSGRNFATRSEVLARNAMAATSHPIATQIAIDILKKGGSAIDAAIAANAFIGFADPGMNGIGGDLFAIIWDPETKKLEGLNASGRTPQNLTLEILKKEIAKGKYRATGPLSISTPGCVDGWFALHEKYGKLDFSELLAPAIQYAREGIPITAEVADWFSIVGGDILESDNESFKKVFCIEGKRFPKKGEIFQNPNLANTLEKIAAGGRKGFYEGSVANTIVKHIQNRGGYLSLADLKENEPEWVEPISINYRGYDVWELPPNGQGVAVLQMLNILKNFDIRNMGFGSSAHIHHFLEAKKLAFEDLAKHNGDPDFSQIPLERLISDQYGKERSQLINPQKAGEYESGLSSSNHTIYLTVGDKDGMMVSFIQSNFWVFGSTEVPDGLGFALQNRGSEFVLEAGHANQYQPGKRPFHTIIPGFVTKDGEPFLSFGVMGGDMQPQGHVQVLLNLIDFEMNIQEAGDAPRIRHFGTSQRTGHIVGVGDTYMESGFRYETISELIDRGHVIRMTKGQFGGYQAIMRKNGVYYGASDPKKRWAGLWLLIYR